MRRDSSVDVICSASCSALSSLRCFSLLLNYTSNSLKDSSINTKSPEETFNQIIIERGDREKIFTILTEVFT